MRVRGDVNPGVCRVEKLPSREGFGLARLFENAVETGDGWEYDEYQLTLPWYDGLPGDVAANPAAYLSAARAAEEERDPVPRLRARIAELETEKAALERDLSDTQLALCDVYEMIGGGG